MQICIVNTEGKEKENCHRRGEREVILRQKRRRRSSCFTKKGEGEVVVSQKRRRRNSCFTRGEEQVVVSQKFHKREEEVVTKDETILQKMTLSQNMTLWGGYD